MLTLSYDSTMRWCSLVLIFCIFNVHAAIYRSVDEHGNVSYTDNANEGGQQIELDNASTYTPIKIEETVTQERQDQNQEEIDRVPDYQVAVIFPNQDQSFWDSSGAVTVEVELKPELNSERGDRLLFTLDGEQQKTIQGGQSYTFNNVDRGSHIVVVSVIDKQGNVLTRSKSILFHLHRRSIINNPPPANQVFPSPRPAKAAPNAQVVQ